MPRQRFRIPGLSHDTSVVALNSIGALVVRGGALFVSLLMMPAYIRYFDDHRILGLWFTIVSLASWVLTFDFGLGNGLRNHLVPIFVARDYPSAREYISAAYLSMGAWAGGFGAVLAIMFLFVDWNSLLNVSSDDISSSTLKASVIVVLLGMVLQLVLKLSSSILYAMQKSALSNSLGLLGAVLLYAYVALGASRDMSSNMISLACANAVAMNLPLLAATFVLFVGPLKSCRPSLGHFRKDRARDVGVLGAAFFWVQVMYLVITGTDLVLVNQLVGSEAVVDYQIYAKPFTVIGGLFVLGLTPVWSAVTKAASQNGRRWISKVYWSLVALSCVGTAVQFGLVPVMQPFVHLWLGSDSISVDLLKCLVFALYGSVLIWVAVMSTIANGLGQLKVQLAVYTIGAACKVPFAWMMVSWTGSWVGVALSSVLVMGVFCVVQAFYFARQFQMSQV